MDAEELKPMINHFGEVVPVYFGAIGDAGVCGKDKRGRVITITNCSSKRLVKPGDIWDCLVLDVDNETVTVRPSQKLCSII